MNIQTYTQFVYWLVILGLALFLYSYSEQPIKITTETETQTNNSGDGELSGVQLAFFSPQGKRIYHLEADVLSYHGVEKTMQLQTMQLTYTTPDASLVILTSENGQVLEEGVIVELQGDVHIRKPSTDETADETAETRNLTIDTRQEIANTQEHAKIYRGDKVISGDGMEINLNSGTIRLLSNVEATNAVN